MLEPVRRRGNVKLEKRVIAAARQRCEYTWASVLALKRTELIFEHLGQSSSKGLESLSVRYQPFYSVSIALLILTYL